MLKFVKCLEDGQFEIWRSINHSSKTQWGEIILDWDNQYGKMFTAQVVTALTENDFDDEFTTIGLFETFEEAVKQIESAIDVSITN